MKKNGNSIIDKRERLEFWDFRKLNTIHPWHPYPGMMIPQVARELIKLYGKNSKSILDPFMGCGSTLVEAFLTYSNIIWF